MKKILLMFFILFITNHTIAQQQWRFYIAFEEAMGAKDTIWLVWDTTAHTTFPIDTALGEGRVQMNLNDFNVFVGNFNNDSTKTVAIPYSYFPTMETEIDGFNYNYPIKISWDTSLFHASYLPGEIPAACILNEYFFFSSGPCSCFNMLYDDHVEAPFFSWGSQDHFPLSIHFDCSGENIENIGHNSNISLFPNPVLDRFSITSKNPIMNIIITDLLGNEIYKNVFSFNTSLKKIESINLSNESDGIFFLKIKTFNNSIYYEKFIKIH